MTTKRSVLGYVLATGTYGHMHINPESWNVFPPTVCILHTDFNFQTALQAAVLSFPQPQLSWFVSLMTSPGEICGLWCDFAEVAWFFEEHMDQSRTQKL